MLTLGGQTSDTIDVALDVYRADEPSPGPGDAFAIGSIARGGPNSFDIAFGSLGPLSFSFEWLIPSLVVSGPGLLILIVIGAQLLAGSAWLPLGRQLADPGENATRMSWRSRSRGASLADHLGLGVRHDGKIVRHPRW